MRFAESVVELLQADLPASFERFTSHLDSELVESALQDSGTATVRRRRIPSQHVVWLVIGMALFRDRCIQEVVSHLHLVLPRFRNADNEKQVDQAYAPSAVTQARYRVGAAPLEILFAQTALHWAATAADQDRWRGLALYGVDGTTLRIPDTEVNREDFGLPATGRGQSGYPQVRLVALMALRSHLIAATSFGPYAGKKTGECTLAKELWPQVPERSLLIVDRNFLNYGLLFGLSHDYSTGEVHGNKHWLIRTKKNTRWKTLKVLGEGDELVELKVSSHARKKDPMLPKTMMARAVRYQVRGYRPQTLLTSLVDPTQFPALEIAQLYHARWEIELGYDEVKTHMLERQEALRSKKPEGVRQEIWGVLLAYNLVRKEMLEVADAAGVPPVRVSFRHSLQLIRVFCLVEAWTMAPGNIPKRLAGMQEMMQLLILPERRSERRYKRHVKIKMSKYKRNPGRPAKKTAEGKGKNPN
jgi:hypothetical protein